MSASAASVGAILHDLKTSWYFRIWSVLWLVCFIVWLAAWAEVTKRPGGFNGGLFRTSIQPATTIFFPNYHFRFVLAATEVVAPKNNRCTINNGTVVVQTETSMITVNGVNEMVITVSGGQVAACSVASAACDNRLTCSIDITNGVPSVDRQVAFELVGNEGSWGDTSYSSVWISPNDNAWVMLTKSTFSGQGLSQNSDWDQALVYHAAGSVSQYHWNITAVINTFNIWHYSADKPLSGRQGFEVLGHMGGVTVFLYMLHATVMFLLGFCMVNESTFLHGEAKTGSSYQNL